MKSIWDRRLSTFVTILIVVLNAAALWPELSISRVDLNDNVFHFTLIERIADAVQHGQNPLDCWSPEWSFGFPVLRIYQPLAHLLVVGAWLALGKAVPLLTVFVWARFLSLALLPLSFFAAARLIGLRRPAACAAALLAPLVSTNFLYGIEYGSFAWAGSGLYPQAVAAHLMLLALGFGFQAVRTGRRVIAAGVLVGLTLACHLIYGYMAAVSLLLLALLPDAGIPRIRRLGRTLAVGATALAVSAFQLLPLVEDAGLINHSRWEPVWKWDSLGAGQVLRWLFTGELLDHGRLPVLTVLAAAGVAVWAWRKFRGETDPAGAFAAAGAAFWILLYFGRPFWGPALLVLGAAEDMHLHRVIGGAQVFLVLLAGIALGALWNSRRPRGWIAAAVTILLLYPMVRERARFLANDAAWGRRNLAAYATAKPDLDAALAAARAEGGRVYAGLAAGWGGSFKIGDVPVYAFLSTARLPAVDFLYHSMALTGDLMLRFNDWNLAHYRLFNIRSVILPGQMSMSAPVFPPRGRFGNLQVFGAPGGGYFDVVDAAAAVKTTRRNFYDVNDRWLASPWVARREHLLLDWDGRAPAGMQRIAPDAPLPFEISGAPEPGAVMGERQSGETYAADCEVLRPAYVLFKMTWHPNWKAYVDGAARPVAMLSPGFAAVAVEPGRHRVEFRYEPGWSKPVLAAAGLLVAALAGWLRRRGIVAPALMRLPERVPEGLRIAAGIALLAAPVVLPLLTSSVLAGHDAFEYFPRVIEAHRNVTNGIVLFRWAPDLSHGYGQPLFIFRPPLFYWMAELWKLAGFDVITAVNLACALLVLAAAAAIFRLGRLYFGESGGWLAAAAYLFAPYFAVDLYVRSALEEFAAFPLFALALYGFGAWALERRRRDWVVGACAQAALLCCHFPAALLFTPLLLAFLGLTAWHERSWRVFAAQAAGLGAALGLSAWSWLPALAEKQYVGMQRLLAGFRYADHLVYLHQLFDWKWGYGLSVPGPDDGMSFSLGWSHVLVAAGAWIWISRRRKHPGRSVAQFFGAAGVLLSFLMLEDAVWLWDHLPLLAYVEFPWRLLSVAALCFAMLAAALGPALDALGRWRRPALAAALALLIVPNLFHLAPPRVADVDLALWTPARLASSGYESTTLAEVAPRTAQFLPAAGMPSGAAAGDAQVRDTWRGPFDYRGTVAAPHPSMIRLPYAWYPGWQLRIDGRPAAAAAAAGSGLIVFPVLAGAHEIELRFGRTWDRGLGEAISLFTAIALAAASRRRAGERMRAAAAA